MTTTQNTHYNVSVLYTNGEREIVGVTNIGLKSLMDMLTRAYDVESYIVNERA